MSPACPFGLCLLDQAPRGLPRQPAAKHYTLISFPKKSTLGRSRSSELAMLKQDDAHWITTGRAQGVQ